MNNNNKNKHFRILSSAEVNILKDGSLDISNNVLDKLDIVGAAIHSHFSLPIELQTARLIDAVEILVLILYFIRQAELLIEEKDILSTYPN